MFLILTAYVKQVTCTAMLHLKARVLKRKKNIIITVFDYAPSKYVIFSIVELKFCDIRNLSPNEFHNATKLIFRHEKDLKSWFQTVSTLMIHHWTHDKSSYFFLFLYNVKSLLRILFNLFASIFVKRLRQNSCNKSHSCNFIFRHNKRDFHVAVLYAEGKSDFCFVIVLLSLITYNHWYNALYSVPAVIKRKIMTSYDLLLFLFLLKPFQWLFIMMIFAMNSRYRGIQHLFDSIV